MFGETRIALGSVAGWRLAVSRIYSFRRRALWHAGVIRRMCVSTIAIFCLASCGWTEGSVRRSNEFVADGVHFVLTEKACSIGLENVGRTPKDAVCTDPMVAFGNDGKTAEQVLVQGLLCGGCQLRFYSRAGRKPEFANVDVIQNEFRNRKPRVGLDTRFRCVRQECAAILNVRGTEWLFTIIDHSPTRPEVGLDTAYRMLREMSNVS